MARHGVSLPSPSKASPAAGCEYVVIGDAGRHDVPVLAPDINHSRETCTLEPLDHAPGTGSPAWAVRLGLSYVHRLGEAGQERIVERREDHTASGICSQCAQTAIGIPRNVDFRDIASRCRPSYSFDHQRTAGSCCQPPAAIRMRLLKLSVCPGSERPFRLKRY